MPSTISILLPTYNSTAYLADTLASIAAQQRPPDEVLVVDDKSTDHTLDMVEEWASRQKFAVRVLQNRYPPHPLAGPGPAGGRKTGLEEARTDFIALLDHDDLMLPLHLQLMEQAFERHPDISLCFADATEFLTETGEERSFMAGKGVERLAYQEDSPGGLRVVTQSILGSMLIGSYIPTAANLWRRQAAIEMGGFEPRAGTCDDFLFFTRLSRRGPVAYYPYSTARKRTHAENLSHPKYSLRLCWNNWDALQILQADDIRCAWTAVEKTAIAQRTAEIENEIQYHASVQGWSVYRGALRRMGKSGYPAMASLRALRSSLRTKA